MNLARFNEGISGVISEKIQENFIEETLKEFLMEFEENSKMFPKGKFWTNLLRNF